eukprot:14701759-Alexandrium_andersonii.AAC.1
MCIRDRRSQGAAGCEEGRSCPSHRGCESTQLRSPPVACKALARACRASASEQPRCGGRGA